MSNGSISNSSMWGPSIKSHHGLMCVYRYRSQWCTLIAVPRSTQISTLCGMVKWNCVCLIYTDYLLLLCINLILVLAMLLCDICQLLLGPLAAAKFCNQFVCMSVTLQCTQFIGAYNSCWPITLKYFMIWPNFADCMPMGMAVVCKQAVSRLLGIPIIYLGYVELFIIHVKFAI